MIRRRQGFTLVEMLVVIAIIIILAAVLFPVFVRAREKAQQVRCINNYKQWAAAIELYEDDYEGAILPASVVAAPGTENANSAWSSYWSTLLDPYVKQLGKGRGGVKATGGQNFGQGELLRCPSSPGETMSGGNAWQAGKSYGYNPYLQKNVTTSMVKYPALTLRLTETAEYNNPRWMWTPGVDPKYKGGSWYAPLPDGTQQGYRLALTAPGWHNGMGNVLWVDGHVSTLTWQRIMWTDRWNGTTDPNTWCRLEPKQGITPEG